MIAADGGVDRALALGLHVDLAIGDFDSVTPAGLAAAEAAGARVERHPAAKDATDLELALDAAIALGPARIVVVGAGGGRLDHLLGVVLLLADERYAGAEVDAYLGESRVHVDPRLAHADGHARRARSRCSPRTAPPRASRPTGLEYPLRGETLPPGTSRGVSNVFTATEARVTVERGCLLAVRPAPREGRPR